MDNSECPVAVAATLIADPYVLLIIRDLAAGPCRFSQLSQSVDVNPRTLTARLRRMERDGLIARAVFPEVPVRVEYCLTPKGLDLIPVVEAIRQYGERWLIPVQTDALEASADRSPVPGRTRERK